MADYSYQKLGQGSDGAEYSYQSGGQGGSITFNTFSGTDMRVFFGPNEVGTLMAITIAISRDKSAIYTCLSTNPKGFSRGKRAITGSMVFGQFDRHAILHGPYHEMLQQKDVIGKNDDLDANILDSTLYRNVTNDLFGRARDLQYSDQLPPFDVVITFSNDQGAASVIKVIGVEIVTEGYGYTMEDMSQDMAVSYVAREVLPLTPVANVNQYFRNKFLSHERPRASA